jgi:hypothetical protein
LTAGRVLTETTSNFFEGHRVINRDRQRRLEVWQRDEEISMVRTAWDASNHEKQLTLDVNDGGRRPRR